MKIVMICSGGLDSTILYYYEKYLGAEIIPINFSYGSKHNKIERERAKKLIPDIRFVDIDLSFLKSSLLEGQEAIPHGHYEAENMKSTVVPFRNGIMLSFAIGLAESEKADCVMLGSHAGDHAIYPDCRPEFTEAMSHAAEFGTYNNIKVISPFNYKTKGDLVKIGASIGIENIMAETWTCYEGGETHCGKCGSCTERKEAFQIAGIRDQTIYEE
jgi:7-cyano-7-deazaguanine synthase